MGEYNPHAPYVLGMEWVPIRDAAYEPDQITERGYTLRVSHATTIVSGAAHIKFPPEKIVNYVAESVNIYPIGQEDQTGPIRKVTIPVSNVLVTGNGESIFNSGVEAWLNPSDALTQVLTTATSFPWIGLNFAVEQYAQELLGKRILNVRFAYTAGTDLFGIMDMVQVGIANAVATELNSYQDFIEGPVGDNSTAALALVTDPKYVDIGDLNINITEEVSSFGDTLALALPWRYQELVKFSTATALGQRRVLYIRPTGFFDIEGFIGDVSFGYGALEVFYCEETRVRYGGRFTSLNTAQGILNKGINMIALRDTNFAIPGSLPAGEYLVTHTHREIKPTFVARGAPLVHRLRQLYQLPTLRGTVVDSRVVVDGQFTSELTDELTTITLHTATGVVTGSHPYAERIGAPVYASFTPTQEIVNHSSQSVDVTQVRFYARRFGDTTIPLSFSTSGFGFVTAITVEAFDLLPEIVDGWREVTLNLPAPSTQVAGSTSAWLWSAIGETAGNQWQILGGRTIESSVTVQNPSPATYLPPLGTLLELTWKSPNVTGSTVDQWADATLLLSTEPPMVSGFAVSVESQSITGVGQYCGSDPRCIPTAIQGLRLDWTPFGGCDDFNRVNVDTWNTSSSGIDWATSGGTPSNFYVNGVGNILLPTGDTAQRTAMLQATYGDFDQIVTMSTSQVATGASLNGQSRFRFQDANNYYVFSVAFLTSAQVSVGVFRVVGGVSTNIGTPAAVNIGTYSANKQVHTHVQTRGSVIRMKAWYGDRNLPPVNWQIEANDATFLTGQSGVRATQSAGNTNVNPVISFEDFSVVSAPLYQGGQVEIQRRDPITDWKTIMLTEHPNCVTSFLDLEARVGQLSEYRIRTLNGLDFAGVWVTGSGTIPAPGVTVGGDGNSMLIMTSNQSPTASLAYTMQFEGQAVETFTFPEVDTLQLQRMFGKNFLTAFHPLERGGTQFTRVILVNAAAVALPSLEDFRNLRDLGWADLNYVCIRDELGNRWFANVAVPEGSVRMNRTIYLAEIRVTEVTDTPTPVDPGGLS